LPHLVGIGLEVISKTNIMNDKEQDPNLQAPQEANTTKHINFLEAEEGESTNDSSTGDEFADSPTRKAWEELRNDNKKQQEAEG
jgi:hypothetical protein